MSHTDAVYSVAWSYCPAVGSRTYMRLRKHFSSLEEAWHADSDALARAGLPSQTCAAIARQRADINVEEAYARLDQYDIQILTIDAREYPPLLREIFDPPPVLYYRGTLPDWSLPHIAIVGARKTSSYGRDCTGRVVAPLAQAGIVIVSGLALGIDAVAHRSTLDAGGTTLAVLAGGLDAVYPRTNQRLAERIIEQGGALLSEHPPGIPPLKHHFPLRNRIISGLCHMTVITEGTADSGSLITARSALDQNREVGAIPGPITGTTSAAPHSLLKSGAHLVTTADDILEVLSLDNIQQTIQNRKILPASPTEDAVLSCIRSDPTTVDEIFQACRLPGSTVNTALTTLEMKGLIRRSDHTHYLRL